MSVRIGGLLYIGVIIYISLLLFHVLWVPVFLPLASRAPVLCSCAVHTCFLLIITPSHNPRCFCLFIRYALFCPSFSCFSPFATHAWHVPHAPFFIHALHSLCFSSFMIFATQALARSLAPFIHSCATPSFSTYAQSGPLARFFCSSPVLSPPRSSTFRIPRSSGRASCILYILFCLLPSMGCIYSISLFFLSFLYPGTPHTLFSSFFFFRYPRPCTSLCPFSLFMHCAWHFLSFFLDPHHGLLFFLPATMTP